MNRHGNYINHVSILRRSKDEDSTDPTCCMTDGDPWSVKPHNWKSGAKHDLQFGPGGPSTDEELWSQSTKMNSFRSGPS